MKKMRIIATMLAVALCVTMFSGFKAKASEKYPAAIQTPVQIQIAWSGDGYGGTVTPSAISIGIEVTPTAISVIPPTPDDPAPEEIYPCPPEPIYDQEVPSNIEVTEVVVEEGGAEQVSPAQYEDGLHVGAEEMNFLGYLVFNAADHGIIDGQSPLEFNGNKRLKFGQLALMIKNAISSEGQVLDTKENRKKAIKWVKKNFGISYEANKKMTYKAAKKIFSKVLGRSGELLDEEFGNLKKEGKMFFPVLSLEGDKMSRIEGLYLVVVLLESDMPVYKPLSSQ